MAMPKRLVLFVEGEGDAKAIPLLVKKLLTELAAWDCLTLDPDPFRVKNISNLTGKQAGNWTNFLKAASKRRNLGGVLLLLDGDIRLKPGETFCPKAHALDLAQRARSAGAGQHFSVACVFACQEYETWLIGSIETMAGKPLPPDHRAGVRNAPSVPGLALEKSPRDAKRWLGQQMEAGYKESTDQEALTRLLVEDLTVLRGRQLRSFRRLEKALQELVTAIRSGIPVVTPALPAVGD